MVSARSIDMGRESRNLSPNSYLMWTACAFGTPCCLAGNSPVSFCTWSCMRSMRKQQTRTRVQASTRRDTNIGSIKLLLEWVYDWPVVDWLQLILFQQSCRISVTGKQETPGCGETFFILLDVNGDVRRVPLLLVETHIFSCILILATCVTSSNGHAP